jgi:hypothetical protein
MTSGWFQADTIVANIASLINKEKAVSEYVPEPAGIHLSLGIVSYVLCPHLETSETDQHNACAERKCSFHKPYCKRDGTGPSSPR